MINEEALEKALQKHLCSEHKPCRVAAAHLIEAYLNAAKPQMDEAIATEAVGKWIKPPLRNYMPWETCDLMLKGKRATEPGWRRISYMPGEVYGENYFTAHAMAAFGLPFNEGLKTHVLDACRAYLKAWQQGRIIDTTPEDIREKGD